MLCTHILPCGCKNNKWTKRLMEIAANSKEKAGTMFLGRHHVLQYLFYEYNIFCVLYTLHKAPQCSCVSLVMVVHAFLLSTTL